MMSNGLIAGLVVLAAFTAPMARAETQPVQPCSGVIATPVRLDPQGDNFLAVHPAPASSPQIDQLFRGDAVCVFGQRGVWLHIQYIRDGRGFTGWAHKAYLAATATPPMRSGGDGNTSVTQQQLQQKQIIINVNPNVSQ